MNTFGKKGMQEQSNMIVRKIKEEKRNANKKCKEYRSAGSLKDLTWVNAYI